MSYLTALIGIIRCILLAIWAIIDIGGVINISIVISWVTGVICDISRLGSIDCSCVGGIAGDIIDQNCGICNCAV